MNVLQDFRFALRLIRKEKWFSAVAVVALALGIGVNATVFTLVNGVLIRGLPFEDSGQLYMLSTRQARGGDAGVSYADLQDWRATARSFSGLAAFANTTFNISDDRALPEQVRGTRLTADAFRILRQQPLLGRDFLPDDHQKGAAPVVILGYSIWKNRYAEDPAVVGRSLRLNGEPATIVGVMPEGMQFPTNADLWAPLIPDEPQERRTARFLAAFGRLREGVEVSQARAEMDAIAGRLAAEYPESNKDFPGVVIETFNERFNGGPIRLVFLAMLGAVGFVLLIACANVANLLLSRSAHRAREVAVRIALGATRWRVVRQLLVESILLGVMGGVLGLLIAVGGVRLFDIAVQDVGKPYWIRFSMDYLVFGYLAAVCVSAGILFGLAPALQVSRTNVNDVLKEGGRGSAGTRRSRWLSGTMVVVELALTIVLLVGAGLMIRSFLKMYSLDIGIGTAHLMAMGLQLPAPKYATPEARAEFYTRLRPQLAGLAGVEAAAITTSVPPQGTGRRSLEIEGRPVAAPDERPEVSVVTISPEFFDVAGVGLRRGRGFGETDGTPGNETVMVNERFAGQYFPGEDPVGRRIRFVPRSPAPAGPPPVWRTIVGISPSLRHSSPQDAEPAAVVYTPYRQEPPTAASLLVRSRLEPGAVMSAVRSEVQKIDRDQPIFTVRTLEEMLARERWPFRVFGTLFAIFAVIALILSSVGLYAVMSYSVTQRTQEIGVRMALGAGARQVTWMILRRGLLQVVLGLSMGLTGAFFLSRVLASLLVQITPNDPLTFVSITVVLTLVAAAACLIPARRATRVDPLVALRE